MRRFNGCFHVKLQDLDIWSIEDEQFLKQMDKLWSAIGSEMEDAGVESIFGGLEEGKNLPEVMKSKISKEVEDLQE